MSLDRATPEQFSSSPLLEDPYESIFVEVTIILIQCPFTMMSQSDDILPRLEKVIFRVLEKVYLPEGTFRFTFQSNVCDHIYRDSTKDHYVMCAPNMLLIYLPMDIQIRKSIHQNP